MKEVDMNHPIQNYCKYDRVKNQLLRELETEQKSRTIAGKLDISIHTFHKYKNYLQVETKKIFTTLDEKIFLEKQRNAAQKKLTQGKVQLPKALQENLAEPEKVRSSTTSIDKKNSDQ